VSPYLRRLRPSESLAVVCPPVAAQWHPTRNPTGTPDTVSARALLLVWWGCPRGHEWEQSVAGRLDTKPPWKKDDPSACPGCTTAPGAAYLRRRITGATPGGRP
jgi:hypothetical protein